MLLTPFMLSLLLILFKAMRQTKGLPAPYPRTREQSKSWVKMTDVEFDLLSETMLSMSINDMTKIFKRSRRSLSKVRASVDFDDYKVRVERDGGMAAKRKLKKIKEHVKKFKSVSF